MDRLREQLMQQMVDQMSGAVQSMSPADMQRMKDMLAGLNEMLERRERGEDPGLRGVHAGVRRLLPREPEEPRRAARADGAADGGDAGDAQLDDARAAGAAPAALRPAARRHGPALAARPARRATCSRCSRRWAGSSRTTSRARTRWDSARRCRRCRISATSTSSRTCCASATNPGALAEADIDRVRDLIGDDAARSLERLAQLTKMLEDAGLIEQKEGRLELTPKGLRAIGSNALRDLFSKLTKDTVGQHQVHRLGLGHERTYDTKPYEFGDPFQLDLHRTIRNALRRSGPGTPVKLDPDDFEIERTEHLTRSSTVLMLDLSLSMPMRDNFLPAKKVAMALHSLISSQFPRDYLGLVGFSETARVLTAAAAARGVVGLRLRHQHAARVHAGPPAARPPDRHQADHHDHRRRAHRPRHARAATCSSTTRRCARPSRRRCARWCAARARGSASTRSCSTPRARSRRSSRQLTEINRGRAFFTTPETLGDYVLVDFIEHKRQLARGRRAG